MSSSCGTVSTGCIEAELFIALTNGIVSIGWFSSSEGLLDLWSLNERVRVPPLLKSESAVKLTNDEASLVSCDIVSFIIKLLAVNL